MAEENVVFILTKEDVLACAKEMAIPEEMITDDVLDQVKKNVMWGREGWPEVMKQAINMALKS